jgi:hypothetical protein
MQELPAVYRRLCESRGYLLTARWHSAHASSYVTFVFFFAFDAAIARSAVAMSAATDISTKTQDRFDFRISASDFLFDERQN